MVPSTTTAISNKALSLYRSLLRAHANHLPTEMKQLGDAYVKSEFRLHKTVGESQQLDNFFTEWNGYLHQLLMTARAQETVSSGVLDGGPTSSSSSVAATSNTSLFEFGKDLPPNLELSEEQVTQLEKLREEASQAGKEAPSSTH